MVYRSDEVGGALGWRRIYEMEDLLTGLVLILYPGAGDSGAARAAAGADPREEEIASQMVYAGSPDEDDDERRDEESQQQKDLTELLQMSENDGAPRPDDDKEEDKEEGDEKEEQQHQYESDNGTMYLRDPLTGDWISCGEEDRDPSPRGDFGPEAVAAADLADPPFALDSIHHFLRGQQLRFRPDHRRLHGFPRGALGQCCHATAVARGQGAIESADDRAASALFAEWTESVVAVVGRMLEGYVGGKEYDNVRRT